MAVDWQAEMQKWVQRAGQKINRVGGLKGFFGDRYGAGPEKKAIKDVARQMTEDMSYNFKRQLEDWDRQQRLDTERYAGQIRRQYQLDTLPKEISKAKARGDTRTAQVLEQRLQGNQRYADRYLKERSDNLQRQRYKMVKDHEVNLRNQRQGLIDNAYKQIDDMREQVRRRQSISQSQSMGTNARAPRKTSPYGPKRSDLGQWPQQ